MAWDREAELGNPATVPIDDSSIREAREGKLSLSLTCGRLVPAHWLSDLAGKKVLCLALGGGQQVPLLAAAGACVTSFENSGQQLARDLEVAQRNSLRIEAELGDMQDLSRFPTGAFDLAFVGLGFQFIPNPKLVCDQLSRALRRPATVIAAFVNPVQYLLDWANYSQGKLIIRHALPYSDLTSISPDERSKCFGPQEPIEFGHTMEQLLGPILDAGFGITGFYEDTAPEERLGNFISTYFVVRAERE